MDVPIARFNQIKTHLSIPYFVFARIGVRDVEQRKVEALIPGVDGPYKIIESSDLPKNPFSGTQIKFSLPLLRLLPQSDFESHIGRKEDDKRL